MKCEKARELFSDFCEGTLQRAMLVSLESHLSGCSNCRAELDALKNVWSALNRAPVIEPPANFRELVWEKIDAQEKQAARPRLVPARPGWRALFTRRNLALAGAAILLIILAPFAVPGNHIRAGWDFADVFRREAPKSWDVTAQAAAISAEDPQTLLVPLSIDAPVDVKASVRVISGPARLGVGSESVTLNSSQVSNVELHIDPNSSGKPIMIQLDWKQ